MSVARSTVPVVIVISDVLAVLGSATAGALIAAVSQAAAGRRAERRADRAQAAELFGQIAHAAALVETEKAAFRERRDSWRPGLHMTGQVLLEIGAAWQRGNWLDGAAVGIRGMREWDQAEGARFIERLQAAAALANPALTSLSQLSPQLQAACSAVADALAEAARARNRKDAQRAGEALTAAIAGLRSAVHAFTAPQPRSPRAALLGRRRGGHSDRSHRKRVFRSRRERRRSGTRDTNRPAPREDTPDRRRLGPSNPGAPRRYRGGARAGDSARGGWR